MKDHPLGRELILQCRKHLLEASTPRIKKCLGLLSEEEVWRRANPQVVSVGNLVLHLCGNVRQHLHFGLGGDPDTRRRQEEFDEEGPLPTATLVQRLDETMARTREVLEGLDPESLLAERHIQGQTVNGVETLIHVTEHFSYHTGQISYLTKLMKEVDLGYYAGQDLDQTGPGAPSSSPASDPSRPG